MKNKMTRSVLAIVVSLSAVIGLAACGADSKDASQNEPGSQNSVSEPSEGASDSAEENAEFVADLEEAVELINDQLAEIDGQAEQMMLASDVDNPTQKYGMWILPYYPSDAVEKFISTIQIDDEKFHVTATSAETGKVWEMDQDGNMTEAAED